MRYELLTGRHGRYEDGKHVIYGRGDTLILTDGELASLGARVKPAQDEEAAVPESPKAKASRKKGD